MNSTKIFLLACMIGSYCTVHAQLDQQYQPTSPGVFLTTEADNLSTTDGQHLYTARTIIIQPGGPHRVLITKTEAASGQIIWNYLFDATAGHINVTDITYENNHIYFAGVSDTPHSNIVYIAAVDANSGLAAWSDYHSRDCWFNRAAIGFLNGNIVLGYSVQAGSNSGQGYAELDPGIGFIEYDPSGNFNRQNWYWQDPTIVGNAFTFELLGLTETQGGLLCDGTVSWNTLNPKSDFFHGMVNLDLELDDYATTGIISHNIFTYDCLQSDANIVSDLDPNFVYSAYHGCAGAGGFVVSKSLRDANTVISSVAVSAPSTVLAQLYPTKLLLEGTELHIFGTRTAFGLPNRVFVCKVSATTLALISYQEFEDLLSAGVRSVGFEKAGAGSTYYCSQDLGAGPVNFQWSDLQQTCLNPVNGTVTVAPTSLPFQEYGLTPELNSTLPTTPLNINQQPFSGLKSECDGVGYTTPSPFKTVIPAAQYVHNIANEVTVRWNHETATATLSTSHGEFEKIQVTDLMGKRINIGQQLRTEGATDNFVLTFAGQAAGIYFITLEGPTHRHSLPLIHN